MANRDSVPGAIYLYAKSSASDSPHQVAFEWDHDELMVDCSCPAGERSRPCRHKTALMAGQREMLWNPDDAEQTAGLETAAAWVNHTVYATTQARLEELEKAARELTELKKAMATYWEDGFPKRGSVQ